MTNEQQQRKMLEAAAKAYGIECEIECFPNDRCIGKNRYNEIVFDPTANPADTAEMCAKLDIGVTYQSALGFLVCRKSIDVASVAHYKDHDNSRLKAWMFAATRRT